MAAQSQATATDATLDPDALEGFFTRYMADSGNAIPDVSNPVQELLNDHFGGDALSMPCAEARFLLYLGVCYHFSVQDYLAELGREHTVRGVRCPSVSEHEMGEMSFARLMCRPTFAYIPPVFCPPDYAVVPMGNDYRAPMLRQGLILVRDAEGPAALWVRYSGPKMIIEVMAPTVEKGDAILARLREGSVRLSPFKGQVLKIEQTPIGPMISFLERPADISRDEVILPAGLLDHIERHALGAVQAKDALLKSGRHLKRGLLLHGRPGTGKTHTIKYLVSQMPHATIAIMSARRMNDIAVLRDVMDVIVPGVVVLDDVDLIAEDRARAGTRRVLFQFLDVLDGVAEDQDLLFVMTTNRPNEIEPAIAARPGRVDQALEVPLPDGSCRERLFDLYCDGLDLQMSAEERASFIERTDGVTASFIREVLRRATVAVLRTGTKIRPVVVTGAHVHKALDQLLSPDNPLTPVLLGAVPKHSLPTIAVASQ